MNRDLLPISIATHRITAPKLTIVYPSVTGLTNLQNQQKMNEHILHETYRLIHQQGYPKNPMTESTGYYEIKTNERQVLSLSLFNYAFSGGAHGLTLQKSLTFDAQTGTSYKLQDLFKPGSDYAQKLSALIKQQIQERDIPLLVEYPGIKPDQDYYIADKALIIYYQVYELTAYVYQFPYFPISVYAIQDIINEDGPLGKMIY